MTELQTTTPQRSSFDAAHQPAMSEQALPGGGDNTLQLPLGLKNLPIKQSASCLPEHRQHAQLYHLLHLLVWEGIPTAHLLQDQVAAAQTQFKHL